MIPFLVNPPAAVAFVSTGTSVGLSTTSTEPWFAYRAEDRSLTRGLSTRALLDQIEKIAHMASQPDWDGGGARAVSPSTVEFARRLAAALPAGLAMPEVSADDDGDISFEWSSGPRCGFSIAVRRDGMLSWAGLFGAKSRAGTDVVYAGLSPEVIQFIRNAGAHTAR